MTTIITHAVAFLVGAVVSYLFLRNNPAWKTKADDATANIKTKL